METVHFLFVGGKNFFIFSIKEFEASNLLYYTVTYILKLIGAYTSLSVM